MAPEKNINRPFGLPSRSEQGEFEKWAADNPGAQDLFLYFGDQQVTQEDLIQHINDRSKDQKNPMNEFETVLFSKISKIENKKVENKNRLEARNKIKKLN